MVTVSKALRNHPDLSKETRQRVLRRMEELNYRPNLAARTLVTGRTNLMGLVVPDLVHSFFSQIANAISKVLRDQGYSLVISSSQEDRKLEHQEIDHLLARSAIACLSPPPSRRWRTSVKSKSGRRPMSCWTGRFLDWRLTLWRGRREGRPSSDGASDRDWMPTDCPHRNTGPEPGSGTFGRVPARPQPPRNPVPG
jgi:hypothetical protein